MEQKESINMESKSCLIFPAPLYSLPKKNNNKKSIFTSIKFKYNFQPFLNFVF